MILEVCTVGRKTPSDGKLEISASTADRLRFEKSTLRVMIGETTATATLGEQECQCGKDGGTHRHLFLCSPVLRELVAGETAVLDLVGQGIVEVGRPHPLI